MFNTNAHSAFYEEKRKQQELVINRWSHQAFFFFSSLEKSEDEKKGKEIVWCENSNFLPWIVRALIFRH